MRWLQLRFDSRFDGRSTAQQRSLRSYSDVITAIYLFIYLFSPQSRCLKRQGYGRYVGRRGSQRGRLQSNQSRTAVESQSNRLHRPKRRVCYFQITAQHRRERVLCVRCHSYEVVRVQAIILFVHFGFLYLTSFHLLDVYACYITVLNANDTNSIKSGFQLIFACSKCDGVDTGCQTCQTLSSARRISCVRCSIKMRSSIYEAGFDQVRFILSHFHAKDEHFDYLMLRCTAVHACAVINEISVCS